MERVRGKESGHEEKEEENLRRVRRRNMRETIAECTSAFVPRAKGAVDAHPPHM